MLKITHFKKFPEDLDIRNIAIGLSSIDVFWGIYNAPYTLAEHCLRVSAKLGKPELSMQALLMFAHYSIHGYSPDSISEDAHDTYTQIMTKHMINISSCDEAYFAPLFDIELYDAEQRILLRNKSKINNCGSYIVMEPKDAHKHFLARYTNLTAQLNNIVKEE